MDQSFDPSSLTLAQAADLVAVRAQLGVARGGIEKRAYGWGDMSPAVQSALVGGGLGLVTGLLASMARKKKERQWMRNALLGTLLGAGVGGAAGYGMSQFRNAAGSGENSMADYKRRMQEIADQVTAEQNANSSDGSFWSLGPIGNYFLGDKPFDPESIKDPALKEEFLASQTGYTDTGGNMNEVDLPTNGPSKLEMVGRVPRAVETGGMGYLLGSGFDRTMAARRHRLATQGHQNVSPADITSAAAAQPKVFQEMLGKPAQQGLAQSTGTQTTTPGARRWTIPGLKLKGTQYTPDIPIGPRAPGTTTTTYTQHSGPNAGQPVNISPEQQAAMESHIRSTRGPAPERKPPGRAGRVFGGVGGFLAGLLAPAGGPQGRNAGGVRP